MTRSEEASARLRELRPRSQRLFHSSPSDALIEVRITHVVWAFFAPAMATYPITAYPLYMLGPC
jgi:hypothetical protein